MTHPAHPDNTGWQLQRVITPGGVIAVVTVAAGLLVAGVRVESQLNAVATTQKAIADDNLRQWERIAAQEQRISNIVAGVARIDARTEGMADQLDRIHSLMAKERK